MTDLQITIVGNLTGDPELRFTPGGKAVANLTIAHTPRRFDRHTNEWRDGETLFLRGSIWDKAAEQVAESLTKGTRVIATGALVARTFDTAAGKKTVTELQIDEIGPSLKHATAKVTKVGNVSYRSGAVVADDPWGAPQEPPAEEGW